MGMLACLIALRVSPPPYRVSQKTSVLLGCLSISSKSSAFSPKTVFEKTDSGYMYCLPNENWKEGFYLYAHEGAEILEYNYNYYFLFFLLFIGILPAGYSLEKV